jgi:predicted outer membrane protein
MNYALMPPSLTSDADKQDKRDDHANMEKLRSLSGPTFDREFAQIMQTGHEKAIALLTDAQGRIQDKDERKLIDKLLPTLKDHHKGATELLDKTLKPAT